MARWVKETEKRAAALKVPVILLITPARLPDLASILERVPDVAVVLDHMADFFNNQNGDLKRLLDLSRYPRLYLKLSHVAINSQVGFPWQDTHDAMKQVFQIYGAPRVMWGSDWPFSLSTMTYAQSIAYVQDEMKFLTGQVGRIVIFGVDVVHEFPGGLETAVAQIGCRKDRYKRPVIPADVCQIVLVVGADGDVYIHSGRIMQIL